DKSFLQLVKGNGKQKNPNATHQNPNYKPPTTVKSSPTCEFSNNENNPIINTVEQKNIQKETNVNVQNNSFNINQNVSIGINSFKNPSHHHRNIPTISFDSKDRAPPLDYQPTWKHPKTLLKTEDKAISGAIEGFFDDEDGFTQLVKDSIK